MGVAIRTERLLLRPLATADAPRIRALCGEFAVARWLARVPHPHPVGEAERCIAACLDTGAHVWAIERLDEPGLIGVTRIEGEPVREVLGYWIGRPFWGRGYASEAARAIAGWAFESLRLERVRSGVIGGKDASLRVQEKLGFSVSGRRMVGSRALGAERAHIDIALPRTAWEARA
jgi:RimJ/RimL family protein N-acetyltransferase